MNFPLSRAYLCPDCDCVGDNCMQCDCGNALNLHPLAKVLNRESEPFFTCMDLSGDITFTAVTQ